MTFGGCVAPALPCVYACELPVLLHFVLSWGFGFVLPPAPARGDGSGSGPPFGGVTGRALVVSLAMDREVSRWWGAGKSSMLLDLGGPHIQRPPRAGSWARDGTGGRSLAPSPGTSHPNVPAGGIPGAGSSPLLRDEHLGSAQERWQAYMYIFYVYLYMYALEIYFIYLKKYIAFLYGAIYTLIFIYRY